MLGVPVMFGKAGFTGFVLLLLPELPLGAVLRLLGLVVMPLLGEPLFVPTPPGPLPTAGGVVFG